MNPETINKIRDLQRAEGNGPCFKTGQSFCKWQQECCWSEICLEEFKIKAIHKIEVK